MYLSGLRCYRLTSDFVSKFRFFPSKYWNENTYVFFGLFLFVHRRFAKYFEPICSLQKFYCRTKRWFKVHGSIMSDSASKEIPAVRHLQSLGLCLQPYSFTFLPLSISRANKISSRGFGARAICDILWRGLWKGWRLTGYIIKLREMRAMDFKIAVTINETEDEWMFTGTVQ